MKIHFVGIGGMGLSALSLWSKYIGYEVTGCDLSDGPMIKIIRDLGIEVTIGKNEIIDHPDIVVVSSAVPKATVDDFKKSGFEVVERMDFVASKINPLIGVTGTDGKSSTTFMSQWLAAKNGLDPAMICGAIPVNSSFGTFKSGKDGIIFEVDESDPKMEDVKSEIGLLTNLRYDHLDRYQNDSKLQFEKVVNFLKKAKYTAVPFDFDFDASIKVGKGGDIEYWPIESEFKKQVFKVKYGGTEVKATLNIAGVHQIANAATAIAGGILAGLPFRKCAEALSDYPGLKRRLEVLHGGELTIVDDYAHTPDEVKSALISVRPYFKKIIAIFEPHRYTRFSKFEKYFADALSFADEIYVTEIFGAFEDENNIGSEVLADDIKSKGKSAKFVKLDEIVETLKKTRADLYIFMGAGNITYKAHEFADEVE